MLRHGESMLQSNVSSGLVGLPGPRSLCRVMIPATRRRHLAFGLPTIRWRLIGKRARCCREKA